MSIEQTNEKRFEQDIETSLLTESGYTKCTAEYNTHLALYPKTLTDFIKETQPKEWKRFANQNPDNAEEKFCKIFSDNCETYGILELLRHGFKHRGIYFRVCYFKPESTLNQLSAELYSKNCIECKRQWYYSDTNPKLSVDLVIIINGIPVFAIELKNQYTGQTIENAKLQWMYDREKTEPCFRFNKRILAYFCVDHTDVYMTTRLEGKNTTFLPFNQGSQGAGTDGGKGNPPNKDGYPTAYFWEIVFAKDSMMDIIQKFISIQTKDGKEKIIFPRYHQLDAVRKIIADISENGSGKNYLIQHSAGSGKSNTIAWTTYRLASLHNDKNEPVFSSVIIVTDRTVLDKQLQETISSFDHVEGTVITIDDNKNSKDLRDAINDKKRIIVTTLQKFPIIYNEIDETTKRNFAVIVDEAHSSQTGKSAAKLKTALADTEEALREYADIEGKEEDEIDKHDKIVQEMLTHGKHKNLTYIAFTATPKDTTLEQFGTKQKDGSYRPFHVYSMKQAIEEGFILDVLQNYMTYDTCFKIAKTITDNPDLPSSKATKIIRKFEELHPYNISQKTEIIIETFRETTANKINGKGKMMVVTSSRLGAVRYYHEAKRYIEKHRYNDIDILVAFSGAIKDGELEYSEEKLNKRKDGSKISETQTKSEFHDNFNVLIVAEKYQTGFDEPLLHTMIVDKKLKGVKAVQTLSRLNRVYPGKNDTFILDFINTKEDIIEAFQPFYQETVLEDEVNVDLIYQTQKELREYKIYTDENIEAFINEYTSYGKQDAKALGRMTSILKPVTDRYNTKTDDERYQFRRLLRSFIKWYGYISQVSRMFDLALHKEYLFSSYFFNLLPKEITDDVNLEGKLKLEYYKLKETYKGSIELQDQKGVYEPVTQKAGAGKSKKEPLDEILEKINERYKGNFTEGDKVLLSNLYDLFKKDKILPKLAQTSNFNVFKESIFPDKFSNAAQKSYEDSQETFTSLFKDKNKYEAIRDALAYILYKEMNK